MGALCWVNFVRSLTGLHSHEGGDLLHCIWGGGSRSSYCQSQSLSLRNYSIRSIFYPHTAKCSVFCVAQHLPPDGLHGSKYDPYVSQSTSNLLTHYAYCTSSSETHPHCTHLQCPSWKREKRSLLLDFPPQSHPKRQQSWASSHAACGLQPPGRYSPAEGMSEGRGVGILHRLWYGIVWYYMVWYGIIWYSMVLYGMVRYGTYLCSATSLSSTLQKPLCVMAHSSE